MATSSQKALEWENFYRCAGLDPTYSRVLLMSMEELLERYEMDEWREPISVNAYPPRFVTHGGIMKAKIAELRRQAVASVITIQVSALKLCEASPIRGVSSRVDGSISLDKAAIQLTHCIPLCDSLYWRPTMGGG